MPSNAGIGYFYGEGEGVKQTSKQQGNIHITAKAVP